jgi:carboxyl-terminal processing protease
LSFKFRATDTRPYLPIVTFQNPQTHVIRVLEADEYREQFLHDLIEKANTKNIQSLVLDLRNNTGGTVVTSLKMAAAFWEKPSRILVSKKNENWVLEFDGRGVAWFNPKDPNENGRYDGDLTRVQKFSGRVAIITSSGTVSAGEQLASLLQTDIRAKVFGDKTAGALDSSADIVKFSQGANLLYGSYRYQDSTGNWLPPRVTPDELVPLDLDALTQGRDTQLEAALRWLEK